MPVKAIRSHQPDLFISCKRLTETAKPGNNVTSENIVPRRKPVVAASMKESTNEPRNTNNVQYQYSGRLDLVLKSPYLRKPEAIASVKPILGAARGDRVCVGAPKGG